MTKQDILIVLPEIVIALMACFILVLDLYLPATKKQKFGYGLSMAHSGGRRCSESDLF